MEREFIAVRVAVLLVTDEHTERDEATVKSIATKLTAAGHRIVESKQLPDKEPRVREQFATWLADPQIDVVIAVAGIETESTSAALAPSITRPIEGFADLFRMLTYGEIGTGAMLVDVTAAQCGQTFVFVLPASQGAVTTAVDKLLIPQLDHRTKPRNLVMRMPRLQTPTRPKTASSLSSINVETVPAVVPPGTPSGETEAIDESMLEAVPTPVKTETTDVGVPPPPPIAPGARAKTVPPPVPAVKKPTAESRPLPKIVRAKTDPLMTELASVVVKTEREHTKTEPPKIDSAKVEPVTFDPSKGSNPELRLPGVSITPLTTITPPPAEKPASKPDPKPPEEREVDPPGKIIVDDSLPSTIETATAAGAVVAPSKTKPVPKLPAVIVEEGLATPTPEVPKKPEPVELAKPVSAVTSTSIDSMFDERVLAAPRRRRRMKLLVLLIGALAVVGVALVVIDLASGGDPPRRTVQPEPTPPPPPPIVEPVVDPGSAAVASITVDAAAEPEIEMDPTAVKPRRPKQPAGSGSDGAGSDNVASPDNPKTKADECDAVACILEKYARPCCEKFKPADFDPSAGSATKPPPRDPSLPPDELDQAMIKQGVDRVRGLIIGCREGSPAVKGTVRLQVTVDPGGRVTDVALVESPDPTLGQCVASAMRKGSFAKTVNGGAFNYPFVF